MYKIEITETLKRVIEVEADSIESAVDKVQRQYDAEIIVLDSDDFNGMEIALSEDDDQVVELLKNDKFCDFVLRGAEDIINDCSTEELVKIGFGDWESAIYKFNNR